MFWKKAGKFLLFACGTLVFCLFLFPCWKKKTTPAEKNHFPIRQVEWMMSRYEYAYNLVARDLPEFYFCHPHDLGQGPNQPVRIWDPAKGDLVRGKSDAEVKHLLPGKMQKYWNGPYLIRIPYNVKTDPWFRPYRVFWFCPARADQLTETEKRLLPSGEKGAMIIISAGPDGLLESCARDKSTPESTLATAPAVEKARQKDFVNFDPFHPHTAGRDFFRVLKIHAFPDVQPLPRVKRLNSSEDRKTGD